jgi:hypothetical protein
LNLSRDKDIEIKVNKEFLEKLQAEQEAANGVSVNIQRTLHFEKQ